VKKYLDQLKAAMKVARKHLVSVTCGVLAILAVIACFWPTADFYNDPQKGLAANVNNSVAFIQQIRSLTHETRSLPVMDPGAPVETLTVFPNESVVDQGLTRVQKVHDQSVAMLADAVGLNTHVPLYTPAFFSGPPDARVEGTSEARTEYAKLYLDATAPNNNAGDTRIRTWPSNDAQVNRPADDLIPPLKAGMAPTDDEIKQADTDLQNKIDAATWQKPINSDSYSPESLQAATDLYNQESRTLPMDMARQRAEACKVYLQPGALKQPAGVSTFSGATQAPTSSDIWDAQRYLWIQEDVATAVAYANEDAANVMDSAVKQIVDVELPTPIVFAGPTDESAIADDGQVPIMFDQSSSGHVSNGMYDVIHFTVVLDVDAGKVPDVLWNMQKGQLITVLDAHYKSVDSAALLLTGHFIYGSRPVVTLTMDCEELMLKTWVNKIAPPAPPPVNPNGQ
jgi:hypothetical protein